MRECGEGERDRQTHRLLCIALVMCVIFIAFRVRHRWGKMYIGHGRLCVALCHLVVHYWADLQSVHGFHCYDNIAPNAKCQWVLALALCLVDKVLRLAHVNEGSRSFAWHVYLHMERAILPLLPSCSASLDFGWYSFSIPLRVGGWVGLNGSVKYRGGLPLQRRSHIEY